MEAAQAIFATRPIAAVSIDEIIDAANVAKGSFYNHFADKNAIAEAVFNLVQEHAVEVVTKFTEGDWTPAERIARGCFAALRFTLEHPESAGMLHSLTPTSISPDSPMNRHLRKYLREAMEDRSFRHMPMDAAMLLVMGVAVISQEQALAIGPQLGAVAHAAPLYEAMLAGLGVPIEEAERVVKEAALDVLSGLEFRARG